MGLLHFRPRSAFKNKKKRAKAGAKTPTSCSLDDSDTTCDFSLDEHPDHLDGPVGATEESSRDDPPPSIDPRAESGVRRVSFRDEGPGPAPLHIVTHTHHRPRTTDDEKHELYYSAADFDFFRLDDMIECEMRKMTGGDYDVDEDAEIENFMRAVGLQRHCARRA